MSLLLLFRRTESEYAQACDAVSAATANVVRQVGAIRSAASASTAALVRTTAVIRSVVSSAVATATSTLTNAISFIASIMRHRFIPPFLGGPHG